MNNVIQISRTAVDKLLSNETQQTTRPQTDRFKVGDVAHIYNQQRRKITDKVMRCVTPLGEGLIIEKIVSGTYPDILTVDDSTTRCGDRVVVVPKYYAHLLGKVELTEVYDIYPYGMSEADLEAWVRADGFENLDHANEWFISRYDEDWTMRWWTVIKWDGWIECYFLANGEQP